MNSSGASPSEKALAVALVVAAACGSRGRATVPPSAPARPATLAERALALLPEGAQLVVELDLARLRDNQVVGSVATALLADLGADAKLPGLPIAAQGSPLASAELVVLAAYGVGTAQAATVTLLASKPEAKLEVPGAVRLADDLVAVGPPEWTNQLEARAAIARDHPLVAPRDLLTLREHAMPPKAPGAVLRVTARLPFDARVALARMTGVPLAPARLSVWADVVDDFAMIVDADATDPGDERGKDAVKQLGQGLETLFATLAADPVVRALGVPHALTNARFAREGSWVRAIVAIGPRQLARAAERARAMLGPAS